MKIHARYEPSFCISLQAIVIPQYSYRKAMAFHLVDRFVRGFAGLFIADDVGAGDTTKIITSDSEIATKQILIN